MTGVVVDERLFWDIGRLATAYRQGEVSPVEIIEAVLLQVASREPQLNAFITVYANEARTVARSAEMEFQKARSAGRGEMRGLSPLLGVPIGLKDLMSVGGRQTTSGSRIMKDFVPTSDAVVWTQLRAAGALLLGKTNMLEFAYGVAHPDYGQTNNPYDLERTAGGSSGGSAAAVAIGALYGALGTDTGGSIRLPASYCGVVGLKPTYGMISVAGVFPLSHSLDHVGPLARTVRDVAVLMDALSATTSATGRGVRVGAGGRTSSEARTTFVDALAQPSGVGRVAALPDCFLRFTEPAVKLAYGRALETIAALGAEVTYLDDAKLTVLEQTEPTLMTVLLAEAAQIHRPWWDRSTDYAPLTWQQIDAGRHVSAVDYLDAKVTQSALRDEIQSWFEKYDVIVTPTVDFPAPKEDPVIGDATMNELRYTGPFNISGSPAVSINCGFTTDGLPIGLQLVGPAFSDSCLLCFAHEFEQTHRSMLEIPSAL